MIGTAQEAAPATPQQPTAPVATKDSNGDTLDKLPDEVAHQPQFQQRNRRYQLRPSDTLELGFSFTPEFNQSVTVQPDGFVTLKELGDMNVQGKTVPEVTAMLRQEYGKILHDPVVTVLIKDFEKPFFTMGGELKNPGKYELRGGVTVTEAVATAGGFRDSAKHSEVFLFRRASDEWVEVKKINVKQMLAKGDLREDIALRAGDMLFVPKNKISKFKEWIPHPSLTVPIY
jgi:polysaccharide export outer membrane protein